MDVKFGTSGLRGLASDLASGPARRHVAAFICHLQASGQVAAGDCVLVGRDLRASSPQIADQCLAALHASGMRPVDCGALPTPALALLGLKRAVAGIMITGSHIPADRNGLKFYAPAGEITKADEDAIAAGASKPAPAATSHHDGMAEDGAKAAWAGYRERYRPFAQDRPLAGQRIGIYQHSSVARDLLQDLLAEMGADPVPLGRSDHFVPVDTEALDGDVETQLREWAARYGLNGIVSTDADGDRPLVADETGRQIRGDVLGLLTARFVGATHAVTPVTSSSGLEAAFAGDVMRTRVGSPHVIAAMQAAAGPQGRVVAGFEANGGFLLASPARCGSAVLAPLPTRDGILPILATLMAPAAGQALSAMVADIGLPVARSDRIKDYAPERSGALLARLAADPDSIAAFLDGMGAFEAVDMIDGVRMRLAGGEIVHLRASGNAPEMRCYVEAGSQQRAADLLDRGLARLNAFNA